MNVYRNNGMYLQYTETYTHTGVRKEVSWTKNINEASVLNYLPFHLRRDLQDLQLEHIKVTVQRTVVPVGE